MLGGLKGGGQRGGQGSSQSATQPPVGRERVRVLYEEYIKLGLLRQVWSSPVTDRPLLEPCFAAGFHGIELCLLLLAQFMQDGRKYVAKRPRVEMVAEDIATQCRLLTEVIDGELEEEEGGECEVSAPAAGCRLSLTQPFPFEGCPPTTRAPATSPGLRRLVEAVGGKVGVMSPVERNSIIKLVLNLSSALGASFQRWSVGLGIEGQLSQLRSAVGLPPLPGPKHALNLDYATLVRPEVAEQTLTGECYVHAEDFFFRTVHLGTECWAFVALNRIASAYEMAQQGRWHVAAARAGQAAHILQYLGRHVMLLTRMNLHDYLLLKVELEGTSGEGSIQVKALRPAVRQLFEPLARALLRGAPFPAAALHTLPWSPAGDGTEEAGQEAGAPDELQRALLEIYEAPDKHAGLYNFAKSLEDLETGLLGGFFFGHFCLAANVIGSNAHGTMQRAVSGLKRTYETPVFPRLDAVRSQLGRKMDQELTAVKGRIMETILSKHGASTPPGGAGSGPANGPTTPTGSPSTQVGSSRLCPFGAARSSASGGSALSARTSVAPGAGGCPFGGSGTGSSSPSQPCPTAADSRGDAPMTAFEAARLWLYSWDAVPAALRSFIAEGMQAAVQQLGLRAVHSHPLGPAPLAFLDHAWGQLSPTAQLRALQQLAGWQQLGNPSWELLLGQAMPEAAGHIWRLLRLPEGSASVQFGHNVHELAWRLLSALWPLRTAERAGGAAPVLAAAAAATAAPSAAAAQRPQMQPCCAALRVLASDNEFYSFVRQANRLAEAGLLEVDAVPAEPAEDFMLRCAAAVRTAVQQGRPYHAIYASQYSYLTQRCLISDVVAFVEGVLQAAAEGRTATTSSSSSSSSSPAVAGSNGVQPAAGTAPAQGEFGPAPLVVIDGYHGWCAVPTDLSRVADHCCYVAGMLKHAGCGPNCAFVTLPVRLGLRPLLTGWLADPSVLGPGADAPQLGAQVNYSEEVALLGGTPSFALPLLTFNHLMALWRELGVDSDNTGAPIALPALHAYVVGLQERLLAGLSKAGHSSISMETLLPLQDAAYRSHTLVFEQRDVQVAAEVVERLAAKGVLVDARGRYVRVGFGPNHSAADVDALLRALQAA